MDEDEFNRLVDRGLRMGEEMDEIAVFNQSGDFENLSNQTKNRRTNMSNTTQEELTVEAVTQYGIKANGGKNYSISTKLAGTGVTPQSFVQGSRIVADVWTGPQGGKKINNFRPAGQPVPAYQPMPPQYQNVGTTPQMPPALPATNVASTPAPGGIAPVSKTPRAAVPAAEDKMSKAEWADRNREISIQAVIKSSIESPALGEHVTGKSKVEFLALTREFIKENLETYRMAVNGTL